MILAMRSGPPGLKGRRRTRDWSGLRIVDVRLTWIDMACVYCSRVMIGSLKLVSVFWLSASLPTQAERPGLIPLPGFR